MRTWRLVLAIGAVLALSVAIGSVVSSSGRAEQVDALREKVDSLATRLQSAQEEIKASRAAPPASRGPSEPGARSDARGAAAAAPAAAPVSERSLGDGEERTEREAAARAPTAPTPQEVVAHFEEAFFTSPNRDPAWAKEAQTAAVSKLREILPQSSQMRAVECHSTMCRIETVHDDVETYRQFAQRVVFDSASRPWNGAVFAGVLEDGKPSDERVTTVMYIAREGESLPMPPRVDEQRATP